MRQTTDKNNLNHGASGGTLMGFVLGLLLGIAIAVGVAYKLTKGAPEPKLNLRAPDAISKSAPAEAVDEGEIQVEERPNLNKPLQSKVPLPSGEGPAKGFWPGAHGHAATGRRPSVPSRWPTAKGCQVDRKSTRLNSSHT